MCNSVCTGSSAFWEEHVDSLKWLDSSCPNTPHMYFSTVWRFDCFLSSSDSLSFDWSTPDSLPNKTIQFMSQTTLYNLQRFCVRTISNLILSTILSTMYVERQKKKVHKYSSSSGSLAICGNLTTVIPCAPIAHITISNLTCQTYIHTHEHTLEASNK